MTISGRMTKLVEESSWIRRMFEEGLRLKRELGEDAVADLTLGNPSAPPPACVNSVLAQLLAHDTPGAHLYMSNAGFPDTRAAIARMLQEVHAVELAGDRVVMSCGAAGGLNVVLKVLVDPGDEVVMIAPYFPEYKYYIENHGGIPCVVDSDPHFGLDGAAVAGAVNARTKAVIINSPNNPTGVIYSSNALRGLCDLLRQAENRTGHAIYVIADEAYRGIVYDGVVLPSVFSAYPNAIVVGSFSKSLSLAGERIGYVAVSPQADGAEMLCSALQTATRILGFVNAPALMQRVVAQCHRSCTDIETYRRNRDVLCTGLTGSGYEVVEPQGAFYVFPKCPVPDDVEFCGALGKRGVLTVPGSGFGRPGHMRIAFCVSPETVDRALPVLRELGRG